MLLKFQDKMPFIHEETYIAENAVIIGDVTIGNESSVWFGAVVRGDGMPVRIGAQTNIQDNATVHSGANYAVKLGNRVSVGHNAIVHGCTIDDNVVVGMGAIIMNGAHIGSNSIIGAGALVRENMDIPEGSVVVGSPARIIKEVSTTHLEFIVKNAGRYVYLTGIYLKQNK